MYDLCLWSMHVYTKRLHQRLDVGNCDLFFDPSFLLTSSSLLSLDVPKEQRLQAVRAAILLMPDENREVLQTLLYFLRDVTSLVEENQMTPMNLAVCLGPSLFHLSILKNEALSPRCIYDLLTRCCRAKYITTWGPREAYILIIWF